jgi:hypothetical protein
MAKPLFTINHCQDVGLAIHQHDNGLERHARIATNNVKWVVPVAVLATSRGESFVPNSQKVFQKARVRKTGSSKEWRGGGRGNGGGFIIITVVIVVVIFITTCFVLLIKRAPRRLPPRSAAAVSYMLLS